MCHVSLTCEIQFHRIFLFSENKKNSLEWISVSRWIGLHLYWSEIVQWNQQFTFIALGTEKCGNIETTQKHLEFFWNLGGGGINFFYIFFLKGGGNDGPMYTHDDTQPKHKSIFVRWAREFLKKVENDGIVWRRVGKSKLSRLFMGLFHPLTYHSIALKIFYRKSFESDSIKGAVRPLNADKVRWWQKMALSPISFL